MEKRFTPNVGSTVGSNFFAKYIKIPNIKDTFTLQIWDLAGQDRYKWVRHEFYKGAKGIVYVFDLTRRNTFESIIKWKDEISKVLENYSSILVGNKLDLIHSKTRAVEKQEAENLKKRIGACAYIEASAKIGNGVKEFFLKLVSHIYRRS